MFSLIITIISIALVAALALATLFYGGQAFNKGAADAEAAKILIQAQQLLGAADLYRAERNAWPTRMQDLLDENYLKSVPSASVDAVRAALAAPQEWTMSTEGEPVFKLVSSISAETCAAFNQKASLGARGILLQAYPELQTQCFGPGGFTVLAKKGDSLANAGLNPAQLATLPLATARQNDDAWTMLPGAAAGGGTGGGTPVAGTFGCTIWGWDLAKARPTDELWITVIGPNAGTEFASTTVLVGSTSAVGENFWTDTDYSEFTATLDNPPGGVYQATITGTNGQTASCELEVVSEDLTSPDDSWDIALSSYSGPYTGGQTITIDSVGGTWREVNGQKPAVLIYTDAGSSYRVPSSNVRIVDTDTLSVVMPAAASINGVTSLTPFIEVTAANVGSMMVGYAPSKYLYTGWPALPGEEFLGLPQESLTFPSTELFTTAEQTLVVTNTASPSDPDAVSIVLNELNFSASNFTATLGQDCYDLPTPRTLAPGESCTVEAYFTPYSEGERTQTFVLGTSVGNKTITLTGVGAPALPAYDFSTNYRALTFNSEHTTNETFLAYPTVPVGGTGVGVLTLTNNDSVPVPMPHVGFTEPNTDYLASAMSISHDCPAQVNPGQSCSISVTYSPQEPMAGAVHLVIYGGSRLDSSRLNTTVFATTRWSSHITFSYSSDTHPSLEAGGAVMPQGNAQLGVPIEVRGVFTNITPYDMALTTLQASSTNGNPQMSLSHDCPAELASGASCNATLTVTPTTFGLLRAGTVVGLNGLITSGFAAEWNVGP